MVSLAGMLAVNRAITSLGLAKNQAKDEGVEALAGALQSNAQIEYNFNLA